MYAAPSQGQMRKMHMFYDELHSLFGEKSFEKKLEIYDTVIDDNLALKSNPIVEQTDFCGFDDVDSSLTPAMQNSVDDQSASASPLSSDVSNSAERKSKQVGEFAEKFKNTVTRSALEQLSDIQSERNKFLRLQFEFEKEIFQTEFELKEKEFHLKRRQFEENLRQRKEDFELKKLEMEKEERLQRLELELKYQNQVTNGLKIEF